MKARALDVHERALMRSVLPRERTTICVRRQRATFAYRDCRRRQEYSSGDRCMPYLSAPIERREPSSRRYRGTGGTVAIVANARNDVGDLAGGTDGRRRPSSRRYSESSSMAAHFSVASHSGLRRECHALFYGGAQARFSRKSAHALGSAERAHHPLCARRLDGSRCQAAREKPCRVSASPATFA